MDEFLVIAKLSQPDGRIGIQATRSAVTVKIDGTRAHTRSSLAARLPVQVIEPGIHKLIEEGPAQRRRYLDWGVFHVEQEFYSTWRRYRKSLDQRNALLKTNAAAAVASSWEETLIAAGDSVQKQRLRYLKKLAPYLEEAGDALFGAPLECRFHRGWPDDQTLAETMMANRQRDQQQAYTHAGPHRADIRIRLNQKIARARVSRGQQKLLASGLVLAQLSLFAMEREKPAVLLLDDPGAELDENSLGRLLEYARSVPAQRFITALDRRLIVPGEETAMFHVEPGKIEKVV